MTHCVSLVNVRKRQISTKKLHSFRVTVVVLSWRFQFPPDTSVVDLITVLTVNLALLTVGQDTLNLRLTLAWNMPLSQSFTSSNFSFKSRTVIRFFS